jgi:hypothetical protein
LASAAKSHPAFTLASKPSAFWRACALDVVASTGGDLHQDVACVDLLGLGEAFVLLELVLLGDLPVFDLHLAAKSVGLYATYGRGSWAVSDTDRRALRDASELVVGEIHGLRLLRRRHTHEGEVHAVVIELVPLSISASGHLHAVAHQRLEALEEDATAELVLELAAVALVAQEDLESLAVEAAIVLELGHAGDRLDQLRVAHRDAEAFGLVLDEGLLDQLVEGTAARGPGTGPILPRSGP